MPRARLALLAAALTLVITSAANAQVDRWLRGLGGAPSGAATLSDGKIAEGLKQALQVGTGNASGGGSAGVAITAGTPQEFTSRNVGVELKVTPTVEEDDYSISLDLNPKVTEFDGFVEYGGPSVAISNGTTVTVPPAVRKVVSRMLVRGR